MWLAPRLRQPGRTAEKNRLREIARPQAAQIERARQHLLDAGRCRLTDLGPLHDDSFRLFLDLLGHTLTQRPDRSGPIEVASADGTLRIRLEPVPASAPATLVTTDGTFTGPDHWITIVPTTEVPSAP